MNDKESSFETATTTVKSIKLDTPVPVSSYDISEEGSIAQTPSKEEEPVVPDVPLVPDLRLRCKLCKEFYHVAETRQHKEYHKALEFMKFQHDEPPLSLDHLLKRRLGLIRYLKEKNTGFALYHAIEKLDASFDRIRRKIDISRHLEPKIINREEVSRVRAHSLPIPWNQDVDSVAVCLTQNKNYRSTTTNLWSFSSLSESVDHFSLCDADHGLNAAERFTTEFNEILIEEFNLLMKSKENETTTTTTTTTRTSISPTITPTTMSSSSLSNYRDFQQIYYNSLKKFDQNLRYGENEKSNSLWSGCSTVSVIQYGRKIFMANLGDCQCLVVRGKKEFFLSEVHTTKNKKERKRVGKNFPLFRTRGVGYHGNKNFDSSIMLAPHTASLNLDDTCHCIVLGSPGLWESLSAATIGDLVRQNIAKYTYKISEKKIQLDDLQVSSAEHEQIHAEEKTMAQKMSECLVQAALLAGSTSNITTLVVAFSDQ